VPALTVVPPYTPAPSLSPLAAFLRLGRLKFLFQSMLVVGLGVTLAVHAGHTFSPTWYAVTLLFAWSTHLMTHYCNEYFDLEADKANASPTSWTGGSRILVDGLLAPIVSLSASFVLLFVAVFLIAAMPTLTARLMAAAITAMAWFYTAPPVRLNYHALGELSCAAVLYGLGPLLTCYLQANTLSVVDVACVGVVFSFQFLRMSIMNLSDIEGDRATGKRTLAVLLGAPRLIRLFVLGQLTVYAAIALLTALRVVPLLTGLAMLATCPVPLWVSRQLVTGALSDPSRANGVTFWSSMHMPITACMITVSLLADLFVGGGPLQVLWFGVWGTSFAIFVTWLSRAVRTNKRPTSPSK
jgi:1,4-dihydroxy-2-naphthoate octaprenyltransferase